jgi:hypothetical protein
VVPGACGTGGLGSGVALTCDLGGALAAAFVPGGWT